MKPDREYLKKQAFMISALTQAKLSTCGYTKVGAVLVQNGAQIATGFNGVDSKQIHCEDLPPMSSQEHKVFSDAYELHAEANALFNALDQRQLVKGATLYCTLSPCENCLKSLARAKVKEIYFAKRYWRVSDAELQAMQAKYPHIKIEHFPIPNVSGFFNDEFQS